MLVRCPECKTEFRLVGFEGDERVVRYFCSSCDRIVRIDLELDEIPSSSSSGSYRGVPRRLTVLVADDDERQRSLAENLLQRAGYNVLLAGDGMEALEMIRDSHPDLVVLDLLMPRLSGFDVLRELERDERLKKIPVVAVSSVIKDDVSGFLRQRGADGFIERADLRERLVRKTRQILGSEATA
jgi:twitching motility two-component system response regulator PilH